MMDYLGLDDSWVEHERARLSGKPVKTGSQRMKANALLRAFWSKFDHSIPQHICDIILNKSYVSTYYAEDGNLDRDWYSQTKLCPHPHIYIDDSKSGEKLIAELACHPDVEDLSLKYSYGFRYDKVWMNDCNHEITPVDADSTESYRLYGVYYRIKIKGDKKPKTFGVMFNKRGFLIPLTNPKESIERTKEGLINDFIEQCRRVLRESKCL